MPADFGASEVHHTAKQEESAVQQAAGNIRRQLMDATALVDGLRVPGVTAERWQRLIGQLLVMQGLETTARLLLEPSSSLSTVATASAHVQSSCNKLVRASLAITCPCAAVAQRWHSVLLAVVVAHGSPTCPSRVHRHHIASGCCR